MKIKWSWTQLPLLALLFSQSTATVDDGRYEKDWSSVTIEGPRSLCDNIAIVGAGPAGVHMALLLKQKGFTNIDILEASDRIGGKSKTINSRGAAHDLGTVFMTTDYHENVIELANKYRNNTVIELVSNNVWRDGALPQPYGQFLLTEVRKRLGGGNISTTDVVKKIIIDIIKYNTLHFEIFGKYEGELMPRPTAKTLRRINGTILQFLERNGLGAIAPVFTVIHTMQGYGHLDDVPAFYGLMWNTPRLMQTLIERLQNKPVSGVFILRDGFQGLWENIARIEKLNVIYNAKVTRVSRTKTGAWVNYKCQSYHYDFVVWTPEMKTGIKCWWGTSYWERMTFRKTQHVYFSTTLVNTTKTKRGMYPIDYWVDNAFRKIDHKVWARRDSYGTVNSFTGIDYMKRRFPTGDDDSEKTTAVMYQYGVYKPGLSHLRAELRQHLANIGARSIQLGKSYVWPYFPRFNVDDIERGIIWDIVEHQGIHRMWYAGSSVIFESVKSVVEYNKLLVQLMKPPCDPKKSNCSIKQQQR